MVRQFSGSSKLTVFACHANCMPAIVNPAIAKAKTNFFIIDLYLDVIIPLSNQNLSERFTQCLKIIAKKLNINLQVILHGVDQII